MKYRNFVALNSESEGNLFAKSTVWQGFAIPVLVVTIPLYWRDGKA
ncbi:hypothetical protein [Xenorhabdus thailandensis]